MVTEHIKARTVWLTVAVAVVVGAVVMGIAYWTIVSYFDTPERPDEVRARTTALVTGWLGAVAIALAILKERVSIRAHNHTRSIEARRIAEHDARLEREHLSDLRTRYVIAAEQLGHQSSAVRIAGANTLAALAVEWEDLAQRQACVDVLCAYLRMPPMKSDMSRATGSFIGNPLADHLENLWSGDVDSNDRQVRLTIQRLIRTHLMTASGSHWGEVKINLSGAWLEDFDSMQTTYSSDAVFDGAVFSGKAFFTETYFNGWRTSFRGATFLEIGDFQESHFCGHIVDFSEVTANQALRFMDSHFPGPHVLFEKAKLKGGAGFARTIFPGEGLVFFRHTEFSGHEVSFRKARLEGTVSFDGSIFSAAIVDFREAELPSVDFSGAMFASGIAQFGRASFTGDVRFERATFIQGPVNSDAAFWGEVSFAEARFENGAPTMGDEIFLGYPVKSPVQLDVVCT